MISSVRRSLEEYKAETEKHDLLNDKSKSNLYAKFLDMPVKENAVFILNYTKRHNHDRVEDLATKITDKEVYCSFSSRNRVANKGNIQFLKMDSDKYYEMLATAKYIVIDSMLNGYFVPRKDQCVITLIDNSETEKFVDKLKWNKIILKSDIVFAENDNVSEIFENNNLNKNLLLGTVKKNNEILDIIDSNQVIKADANKDDKENIVLTAMLEHSEQWMGLVTGYLNNIDYDKYNVLFIINNKEKEELEDFCKLLDSRVNIVTRQGWFLIKEDMRKQYDYFNTDLAYFENPDEIFDYMSKDIYEREFTRTAGNHKADKFIVVGERVCVKNYWINIARALDVKAKEIVYDSNFYVSAVNDIEKNQVFDKTVTKLYSEFDKIYFPGSSAKDEYIEKANKYGITIPDEKIEYLKLYEQHNVNIKTRDILLNGVKNIIYNHYKLDDTVLSIVETPKEGAIGLVIESDKDCEMFSQVAEIAKKTDQEMIIFDVKMNGLKFSTLGDDNSNVTYYVGAIYYYVLMNYIDIFVVSEENIERINELKAANKKITSHME